MDIKNKGGGDTKMEPRTRLKNSVYVLYSILITIIVVMTIGTNFFSNDTSNADSFRPFKEEWSDENGNTVDLNKIKQSMTISCDLPEIDSEQTLFFRVKNLNIAVYENDVIYKQYGSDTLSDMAWYKTPGTYYVQIPVSPDTKRITLQIDNPYPNDSSCNIKQLYIGDGKSILKTHIARALTGFCTSVLIVMLGLVLCALSFAFRKYDSKNKDLLSLGLFACIIGIWSSTETRMIQLLMDKSSFVHLLASSTLLIIAVPILLFFKDRGNATDKIAVPLSSGLTGISFLTSYALHFSGIADMHQTIKLSHATVVISCLFILYYAYKALRKSNLKDPAFWGLLGIGGCSLLDTILYYFQLTTDNAMFARIGVLIYITMLSSQLIGRYVETYSENVKAEMLTKMAYYDVLTGFFNHNSFSSDLKIINKDPADYKGRAIIIFDMNCLKYINDTMGHAMGDTALKESSEYIENNFGHLGKCYRIGGDEYAVITDEIVSPEILDRTTDMFLSEIYKRNERNIPDKPYPLYIATGYAIIETNATDAFNTADAQMYTNKQDIKAKLKLQNAELVRT